MTANLFDPIPRDLPEELVETLHTSPGLRIERIVSRGHRSAPGFWYEQDEDEFVVLLKGQAFLSFQEPEERVSLCPGDWLFIPAGRRHRVEETSTDEPAVWLAVFNFKGVTNMTPASPG